LDRLDNILEWTMYLV